MRGSRRLAGLVVLLLPLLPSRVEGGAVEGATTARSQVSQVSQVPHVPHVSHVGWRGAGAAHDLHETYADLAIEGRVIGGRIRFFKKDLERALGPMLQSDAVSLTPGAEADALVLRYLGEHLTLVAGDTLVATLVRAEEVELGHHPGWQVTVTWEAPAPVGDIHVRNSLLLELHDDQRNIMRFVRFPEAMPATVTFERGAEEKVVAAQHGV